MIDRASIHLTKTHLRSRREMLRLGAGAALASVAGCSHPDRGPPVPIGRTAHASVLGIANERFFPLLGIDPIEAEFRAAMARQQRALGVGSLGDLPEQQLLAVSGGGENGAFGAGLLCGWSVQGTRPTFQLVTGVSTGALIAPFAFLGSDHDAQLRAVYTETAPGEILAKRPLISVLFNDAMADNAPLLATISRYVDERLLAGIAAAYQAGRLLMIATTDLDAQVPVIWNIGAIASSGHPRAVDTVRRLLLASAAIPGAFPPSMIDVTLDGRKYQEMHVDGGAVAQTFLYPSAITRDRARRRRAGLSTAQARAFIIRNGRLDPEWAKVERHTLDIAGRAIDTMIAISGYNDVIRIFAITQRDGIDYNLAFIGPDFNQVLPSSFDSAYMRALFDYGYQRAVRGYDWTKKPPIL
ncbi:Predicted acylesterase/phospholipase RssA, contains patatin domain [Rhodospirillales bacterium URHD0017]|nr:Predicted acylesterase/phospholipase RssA, contains patatin domain [Rhodospirillales bacterium URHD0017]